MERHLYKRNLELFNSTSNNNTKIELGFSICDYLINISNYQELQQFGFRLFLLINEQQDHYSGYKLATMIGDCFHQQKNYQMADSFFKSALKYAEKDKNLELIVNSYLQSAQINLACDYHKEALAYFKKALHICEQNDLFDLSKKIYYIIVNIHLEKNQTEPAEIFLRRIYSINSQCSESEILANICDYLGNYYISKQNYVLARNYFNQMLSLADKNNQPLFLAEALYQIAIIQIFEQDHYQATKNLYMAIGICKKHDYWVLLSNLFLCLGKILSYRSEYQTALEYYTAAIRIKKQYDPLNLYQVEYQIAVCFYEEKKYDQAIEYLNNLYHYLIESEIENKTLALALNLLGYIYYEKKEYGKSKAFGLDALRKITPDFDHLDHLQINLLLANVYKAENNYPEAKDYFDLAHQKVKMITNDKILANYYDSYSEYYSLTGNYPEAINCLQKAKQHYLKRFNFEMRSRHASSLWYTASISEEINDSFPNKQSTAFILFNTLQNVTIAWDNLYQKEPSLYEKDELVHIKELTEQASILALTILKQEENNQ